MTPDPLPDWLDPAAWIVTTEGSTSVAIAVVSLTEPGLLTVIVSGLVAVDPDGCAHSVLPR